MQVVRPPSHWNMLVGMFQLVLTVLRDSSTPLLESLLRTVFIKGEHPNMLEPSKLLRTKP